MRRNRSLRKLLMSQPDEGFTQSPISSGKSFFTEPVRRLDTSSAVPDGTTWPVSRSSNFSAGEKTPTAAKMTGRHKSPGPDNKTPAVDKTPAEARATRNTSRAAADTSTSSAGEKTPTAAKVTGRHKSPGPGNKTPAVDKTPANKTPAEF
jgi:hypothetical protein